MLEIYNEIVSDLIDPQRTNLRIREDREGAVYTEGALEVAITSAAEAEALIKAGDAQRKARPRGWAWEVTICYMQASCASFRLW